MMEASNQRWRLRSSVRRTSLILILNLEYASSGTMILISSNGLLTLLQGYPVPVYHVRFVSLALLRLVTRELLEP